MGEATTSSVPAGDFPLHYTSTKLICCKADGCPSSRTGRTAAHQHCISHQQGLERLYLPPLLDVTAVTLTERGRAACCSSGTLRSHGTAGATASSSLLGNCSRLLLALGNGGEEDQQRRFCMLSAVAFTRTTRRTHSPSSSAARITCSAGTQPGTLRLPPGVGESLCQEGASLSFPLLC